MRRFEHGVLFGSFARVVQLIADHELLGWEVVAAYCERADGVTVHYAVIKRPTRADGVAMGES